MIFDFLPCRTPGEWITAAICPENLEILLVDHLHNEWKAAQSALSLIRRYGFSRNSQLIDNPVVQRDLVNKMSRLAREELRHFEQVLAIINQRNIECSSPGAGRYARLLHQGIRSGSRNVW